MNARRFLLTLALVAVLVSIAACKKSASDIPGQVEAEIDRLLETCPDHAGCRRLAAHARRERAALFTFLHVDAVPATNFLAEQALRPAVVIAVIAR